MEDAFESASVKSDYPVSMMLIAVGFFIVTLVEIFVIKCQKSRVNPSEVPDHTPGSITGHGHSHSGEEGLTESAKLFENAKSESAIYTMLFGLSGNVYSLGGTHQQFHNYIMTEPHFVETQKQLIRFLKV